MGFLLNAFRSTPLNECTVLPLNVRFAPMVVVPGVYADFPKGTLARIFS